MDERKLMNQIGESPGWVGYILSTLLGLFLTFITQDWKYLFFSAIIAGLFAGGYRKGIKYGSISTLTVYFIYLVYNILTSPAIDIMNVFIGIIGITGQWWIILLIVLVIALLVGVTGGYFGSTIHALINWDEWVWW